MKYEAYTVISMGKDGDGFRYYRFANTFKDAQEAMRVAYEQHLNSHYKKSVGVIAATGEIAWQKDSPDAEVATEFRKYCDSVSKEIAIATKFTIDSLKGE